VQGNHIWISQAQIAGREVDFGSIGQISDAENRYFGVQVRANLHREKRKEERLGLFRQLGCQENSKCNSPARL
jgi:hypothetical protein